ncbi:XdhC family protein [Paracoccus sp. S-4012]|uniref:XdhC family protein n=1 Tax=Paracoccus sp. S-4012 TaxID=2665648 RepID=UPI0012B09158|nr:XdhC family protein [Paracoccus sp. S-4012]MRX48954.1 XdhC family protein [Paracoccus sp. S-4012]
MADVLDMMRSSLAGHPALLDPWRAALDWGEGTVLAVLTATHGPAYRLAGAAAAIAADGRFAGAITSGCVEADITLRAAEVRRTGEPLRLRYGEGSPFLDLRLPCGGAIEVELFLPCDRGALAKLDAARRDREPVALHIAPGGALTCAPYRETGPTPEGYAIGFQPDIRFVVFGAGPEAIVFASLVHDLGYDHLLVSHDHACLDAARESGCQTQRLTRLDDIAALRVDPRTAAVLFYHDHDYEPEILRRLVRSEAFYIGAQGSRATQAARLMRLHELGVPEADTARIQGPIGVLPSSRDPRTLAISALAEIIGQAG